MKISFLDFWSGFLPHNNFIYHLIKSVKESVEVVTPDKADLIIYSCFGNQHNRYNSKKIFFTGENKRPNFNECDYSISYDFNDYGGKNLRIPLWYYYIDWFNVGTYGNPNYLIPVNYLYEPNEFYKKEKTGFCSAVYSNPVGIRNDFVNILNSYKKVDCFGKITGFRHLPDGERYKLDIISNYKFNICFENSIYPGYYTEKLLHAKIAGCIPLYYSDEKITEDFNENSFLNLFRVGSMEEMVEMIIKIDSDESLYMNMFSETLLSNKIDLSLIKEKIKNIL
jgi:hypothetical protein